MRILASTILGLAAVISLSITAPAHAQVYDLTTDWSESSNPNGVWTYREGNNALPHINSWQGTFGGYSAAQPGWAESENGNNRLPFWHKSVGAEQFAHDYQAGDVVVHTTDSSNGVGNGAANVIWTSPISGLVDLSGAVWMGREIGRASNWTLLLNATTLSSGSIFSGDPFSRASPFSFAAGSGGAGALNDIAVTVGDRVELRFDTTAQFGDFVGVQMTVAPTAASAAAPEPSALALLALPLAGMVLRRRKASKANR